jgi:CheY-like chemotaxis protein
MRGDQERALAAGCDAYVSKPIDTRAFAALVSAMLNASSRAYAAH